MRKFAGTFHLSVSGDWVKCITEGGRPCSLHAGGEHIAGADLETALAALHEDDDFGMSALVDDAQSCSHDVIHHDEYATLASVASRFFPGVPSSGDIIEDLVSDFHEVWASTPTSFHESIRDYTASMYEDMNHYLMMDDEHKKAYDAVFQELDSISLDQKVSDMHEGISAASTSRDMLVYRCRYSAGIPLSSRSGEEKACYDALDNGGVFMKSNFGSTTTNYENMSSTWDLEDDATRYVIKVPKGSKGLYIDTVSQNRGEREFILDSNTKYRVVGIMERGSIPSDSKSGNWDKAPIIALEVVNS